MKLVKSVLTIACIAFSLNVFAQQRDVETITEEQRNKVKIILSDYNPETLTSSDAEAIHQAFREAGLRGGPVIEDLVKEAGFDPEKLRDLAPPPDKKGDNLQDGSDVNRMDETADQKYSIEQAISDRAQLTTIAFSGLAFITGDFGAYTFIPPGKVCDYFGFQYMRDIDAAEKGHNPLFVDRVVGNVLYILNDSQKQLFQNLAEEQVPQLKALAELRLPLIKSFQLTLDNAIPENSNGLDKQVVINYVGDIFELDAKLSIRRAEVLAEVANSLSDEQKEYLGSMKFGDYDTWSDKNELAHLDKNKSKLYNVAYMTYASEFFSWYAGSVEADVYICPERQGTYFGGFYMKDIPAMSKKDYDISTSITGDSGETFLNDVLNEKQRGNITELLINQRTLLQEVVSVRREISTELRKLLNGVQPEQDKLLTLGRRYGEIDGELSYYYTVAFSKINESLSSEQRSALVELRNLEDYQSAPYYLYSDPVNEEPQLTGVNAFFYPNTKNSYNEQ